MSTISLRIPESLHRRVRELAKLEGMSINQLITTALAEKLSVLRAEEYIQAHAKRGSRSRFNRALAKVKAMPPQPGDELE